MLRTATAPLPIIMLSVIITEGLIVELVPIRQLLPIFTNPPREALGAI